MPKKNMTLWENYAIANKKACKDHLKTCIFVDCYQITTFKYYKILVFSERKLDFFLFLIFLKLSRYGSQEIEYWNFCARSVKYFTHRFHISCLEKCCNMSYCVVNRSWQKGQVAWVLLESSMFLLASWQLSRWFLTSYFSLNTEGTGIILVIWQWVRVFSYWIYKKKVLIK